MLRTLVVDIIMKKIFAILFILIVVVAIIGYIRYNQIYLPKDFEFSEADIHYGCYWGDVNQKKSGTPNNWVLVYSGTHSAQWCNPIRATSMVK